jgi:uroporphyrinogen-III synthase
VNDGLKGARILVTRPKHQSDTLCQLIEQQGGVPVRFPTIEIVSLDDNISATNAFNLLSNAQWLIFTSANAVNFAMSTIGGKIRQFSKARIVAIGKATAKTLNLAGIEIDVLPENGFDSEALLAMPQMQQVSNQSILIVKGKGGREELANGLRLRGANVNYLDVYKRVMPDHDNTELTGLLTNNNLSVIVITSGEALENLLTLLDTSYHECLKAVWLVVISLRIKQLANNMGFLRVAVTENPSDLAILNTMIAIINGDERG